MPRPKVDSGDVRARFFEAAETILRNSGGKKLTLADVTSAVGMTQSNAYRYFPSRDALVAALAERWFADVEGAAKTAIEQSDSAEGKIRGWLLATMEEKTRRFDTDPDTFLAYLELAKDHPAAVALHTQRLRNMIESPVIDLAGLLNVDQFIDALEDATVLFRNPYLVAAQREKVTKARAMAVLDAVFLYFSKSVNDFNCP